MPDILRQLDDLKRLKYRNPLATTLEVIDRCWKLDTNLELWCRELEEQYPGLLYWPQFSTNEELGKLFPIALHLVDLQVAHALSLCWATLVILVRRTSYPGRKSSAFSIALYFFNSQYPTWQEMLTSRPVVDRDMPRLWTHFRPACCRKLVRLRFEIWQRLRPHTTLDQR